MSLNTSSSLHQLHGWLRDGGAFTLSEAGKRLDVTKRQVRRLIQELREADVPVQERQRGREKKFFLPPEEHHAPGLPEPLTEHQVLALTVAAQIARAKLDPTPLAGHLESAVEALLAAYPDPALTFEADTEPNRWHFSDAPSVPIDPDVFWQLREAAKEKHPVHIDYYSASSGRRSTDRKIDPLLIAERRGSWLCVAYCHQRQSVLDFSMAAISALRLCEDERFIPPVSFDRSTYFEGRFGAVAGEETHSSPAGRVRSRPVLSAQGLPSIAADRDGARRWPARGHVHRAGPRGDRRVSAKRRTVGDASLVHRITPAWNGVGPPHFVPRPHRAGTFGTAGRPAPTSRGAK